MKRSRPSWHLDGPTAFRATWGGKQHIEKGIPTASNCPNCPASAELLLLKSQYSKSRLCPGRTSLTVTANFSIVFLFGLWSLWPLWLWPLWQWHGPAILLCSACCWSWLSLVEASLGWAHPLGEALEDPAWGDWLSRSGPATNRRLDGPSL